MSAVYDNWERLVRATLRREELIVSGLRTSSDISLASSSSFSLSFNSSSARVSSFNFSDLLVGVSFSYDQILKATDYLSTSNLIKNGCSGDIFYGVLEDGTQVVVQKIDLSSLNKQLYLRSELEFFGKVSHSRFVPFLGHCLENWNKKFLVYKYMPNKDLSSSLYRREIVPDDNVDCPSTFLDWKTRLKIAIGAAQGLCYLHHQCVPPLVHRNVEASSILIDENFEVRLGKLNEVCSEKKHRNQSWILRLLKLPKSSDRSSDDTSNATCAYDVYCFGKVLLELVTGKTGFSADSDSTMRDWMANALPYITTYNKELFVNIVDPSLFVDEHLLIEVWAVAAVATACLSPKPSKRPHMTHILEALEDPKSVRFSSNGFLEPTFSAVAPALTETIAEGSELAASGTEEDFTNGEIRDLSNLRIYRFSELRAATRNFRPDTVLGEGGFGIVYKGWLNKWSSSESGNEPPIAIKRWKAVSIQEWHMMKWKCESIQEWQNEIDILGRLSHPNLIKLLGFCSEDKELLLVYEFMQNGSLNNHLFGRGSDVQALPWDIRLKILTGAARGLAFLHASEKPLIYRDFNPSHILHGSYNAKISDFGLARRLPSNDESHVSNGVMGTLGYIAPEYMATGRLYMKSDVYGFGVVLAEVLTGIRALDTKRRNGQHNLVNWIKPHLSGRRKLTRIMDYKLEGKYPLETAEKIGQLALMCLSTEPNARPSMKEVVDRLEGIEPDSYGTGKQSLHHHSPLQPRKKGHPSFSLPQRA